MRYSLFYRFRDTTTNNEKKWSMMTVAERTEFANVAHAFCSAHDDIHLHSITVRKQNVQSHLQADGNKLYNYMIRLSLLARMRKHPEVLLIPDPRSIKVQSGNSLPDYLQTLLWFHLRCTTVLRMQPLESHKCLGIQFADMLCGAIQSAFEDNNYTYLSVVAPCLDHKRLYF